MDNAAISPVMRDVSSYIAAALERELPEEVAECAKIHIVDTFAAAISGSQLLPGQRMLAYIEPLGGAHEAGVIASGHVTTALNAALANGTLCHADETDDTHPSTRTHPGTSVVPAALAVAERQHSSGSDLIAAVVLGYDMCARTLLALDHRKLVPTGRIATSTGQIFGAAASAAALLGLDAREVRHTISYAVQQASGIMTMLRDTEHIEKAFAMGGLPAHNGAQAALMVASGFTGVEDVYSGDPSFFSVFSPQADPDALARGLGEEYEITRSAVKRWSVGGPIQGSMQVLHELISEHRITAPDVERIVVRLPKELLDVVNGRQMTDISLQHLMSVMLVDGTMTFAAAHDTTRVDEALVQDLRNRIEATVDSSDPHAVRSWRSHMTVTLKDGRVLENSTVAARGSAENPISREEAEEKALDLMAPVIGGIRARELIERLFELDKVADAQELRALYQT